MLQKYLVDLHCDTIYHLVRGRNLNQKQCKKSQANIPQLQKGKVNIQLFAIFADPVKSKKEGYYNYAKRALFTFLSFVEENKNKIEIAKTSKDIKKIAPQKICAIITLESGHILEGDLKKLKEFYTLGVRSLTLTWNNSNEFAASAYESFPKDNGLTFLGKKLIKEMNNLGMLIDLSHCSEKTYSDVLKITKVPVMVSHSNAKKPCNHFRNLSDKQILAIAQNKGIIGINFHNKFLKENGENVTLKDILKHIQYIKNLSGTDVLSFGSDFDGFITPPKEIKNAAKYPVLINALKKNNFNQKEINKICGENFLRVIETVEKGKNN